jgi:phosphoglucomutase
MALSPLAGQKAPADQLIDVAHLEKLYYQNRPDPADPTQKVVFGTSGHRGTPLNTSFNEAHILAITQAICEYRRQQDVDGPLYMGKDTHAMSGPAQRTAMEVLAANGVTTIVADHDEFTTTPVISHSILTHNRGRDRHLADGIVITPSHNPPADGGFKYDPTNGGSADTDVTSWIANRANELLADGNRDVKRLSYIAATKSPTTHSHDYMTPYINDLASVIDMDVIRDSRIHIGVDPLGGAAVNYWPVIAEKYALNLTVVNPSVDPTFSFMTLDHDGKIRLDCSSPWAMASLVGLKSRFDIAFANDPDSDRHGIVAPSIGLMNPNHYLAVAIRYLIQNRPDWSAGAAIGKTLVSSGLIDRVVKDLKRTLIEVPVGFKWFVPGLYDGSMCFGGEESAGASFLRMDGTVWTTDKDGPLLGLLAAEITARTHADPGRHYQQIAAQFGTPHYTRIDAPATPQQKSRLKALSPQDVCDTELAGEKIIAKLTKAPGNGAPIGGLKVTTANGWFAARPSGTENIYKIYAESFVGQDHMNLIVEQAKSLVARAMGS